jgi:hypothetical protein
MPTYGGATSNSKVTVSHEGARSALGMQAHCAESALAAARRALHFRFHAAADRHSRRASSAHSSVIPLKLSRTRH